MKIMQTPTKKSLKVSGLRPPTFNNKLDNKFVNPENPPND